MINKNITCNGILVNIRSLNISDSNSVKSWKNIDETKRYFPNQNFINDIKNENWTERIVYDDVQYVHGEGGTARTKAKNDMMSTVQGHIHTQAYTEFTVGRKFKVFGMQVGCGVDSKSYAAAYAKELQKASNSCGVIIGGHTAINCLMEL